MSFERLLLQAKEGNADPGFWLAPGSRAPCARTPPSADTASYGEPPPVHCGFSSIQLYHRWPAPPRSSRHGAAAHPPAFERVHQQRSPDQHEARQARDIERLVEQPHAQRELQAGRDVLQDAHGGQWNPACTRRKP